MQKYWFSLRYSFLRTLFLLAADLRRHPTADLGLAESKIDYANLRESQPTARDISEGSMHTSMLYCLIPLYITLCYLQGSACNLAQSSTARW